MLTFSPHHVEQVTRVLLENGADLEKKAAKDSTALILARQNGHDEVCSAVSSPPVPCVQV